MNNKWNKIVLHEYDAGDEIWIVAEVANNNTRELLDSKFDSFFKKTVWFEHDRYSHMKENVLKAHGEVPAKMEIINYDNVDDWNKTLDGLSRPY